MKFSWGLEWQNNMDEIDQILLVGLAVHFENGLNETSQLLLFSRKSKGFHNSYVKPFFKCTISIDRNNYYSSLNEFSIGISNEWLFFRLEKMQRTTAIGMIATTNSNNNNDKE